MNKKCDKPLLKVALREVKFEKDKTWQILERLIPWNMVVSFLFWLREITTKEESRRKINKKEEKIWK